MGDATLASLPIPLQPISGRSSFVQCGARLVRADSARDCSAMAVGRPPEVRDVRTREPHLVSLGTERARQDSNPNPVGGSVLDEVETRRALQWRPHAKWLVGWGFETARLRGQGCSELVRRNAFRNR